MRRFLYLISFFIAFSTIASSALIAQGTEEVKKDSTNTKNILTIDEISTETEVLRNRISSLEKILKPNTETNEVDSILDTTYVEVLGLKDSLYAQIDNLSRRELKIRKVSWTNHKSKLKSLQNILNNRVDDITDVSDELGGELNKWKATRESFSVDSKSEDVFASLDTMVITLNSLVNISHTRLDSIFSIQKRLTELILVVDEAISEINRVEHQMQKDYFVFDSNPIWSAGSDSTITDTNQAISTVPNSFTQGLKNDYHDLRGFIQANLQTFLLEIGFLVFFFVIIMLMRKQWRSIPIDRKNPLQHQTKMVFGSPIASATVVGVLAAASFYDALIPIFSEAHVLLVLIATTILLPRITTKKFRLFLLLILVSYFIEITQVYFVPRSFSARILIIFEASVLLYALFNGRKVVMSNTPLFEHIKSLFKYVIPIYILVLGVSIVLNIIGMVNLSDMLVSGVIFSVALGMIVFLAVKIVTSILVLFFKLRQYNNIQALSLMLDTLDKRFQPTLVVVGMLMWVIYTLKGFDVYDNIKDWVYQSLEIGWKIGEMRISLSSILSFFIIMIVALFIARILAAIFQDEWLIKILPRGVAPAISLLLRIVIITIGLYLAFSAAGFDLTQLGFVFGALSVGIGFGLQNVVLNFIAGLVLAFERPFNLGDTIEIDQEMGVVTNIGIRSSNVKTYRGSEAIIPNGDLVSKKVINWTLTTRDRRSKILMRTAPNADPNTVIELFNTIAASYDVVFKEPQPKTYFYGYDKDGNLSFALLYWTTFDDTLKTDSAIALEIHAALKEKGIQPPMPNQRNFE